MIVSAKQLREIVASFDNLEENELIDLELKTDSHRVESMDISAVRKS